MGSTAIRVENLGKRFRIGAPQARYETLRDSLMRSVRAPLRRLTEPLECCGGVLFGQVLPVLLGQGGVAADRGNARRGRQSPDSPWAPSDEEWAALLADIRERWGQRGFFGEVLRRWAPEVADDPAFGEWFVAHMRRSLRRVEVSVFMTR